MKRFVKIYKGIIIAIILTLLFSTIYLWLTDIVNEIEALSI
jgi:hypothetical protein